MALLSLQVKSFRCFENFSITFDPVCTIICANNGKGKTSIVEALYYLCFLKSFRTRFPQELVRFEETAFFIKGILQDNKGDMHTMQVGYQEGKKVAKLDGQPISSYKEVFSYFTIVVITSNDIDLICGNPEDRRTFLDHYIILQDIEYMALLKEFKYALAQKNALLSQPYDETLYHFWNEKLFYATHHIQQKRIQALQILQVQVEKQVSLFFNNSVDNDFSAYQFSVQMVYKPKKQSFGLTYTQFSSLELIRQEYYSKKVAFGAHLDDFTITFDSVIAKKFSSRGQQKLLAFLIKIAQISLLKEQGRDPMLVLDDFLSDFDENRIGQIMALVGSLSCQTVITTPTAKIAEFGHFFLNTALRLNI